MHSSYHGGHIQLNPSFVSRQMVLEGHGSFEQSSYPNFQQKFEIIEKTFLLFNIPRIDVKSPELHKSVEHIHQY